MPLSYLPLPVSDMGMQQASSTGIRADKQQMEVSGPHLSVTSLNSSPVASTLVDPWKDSSR